MKTFKIKEVQLSRKASMKIKTKLYFMILKKNIASLFQFGNMKYIVSAFTLGVIALGVFNMGFNSEQNIKNTQLVEKGSIENIQKLNTRMTQLPEAVKANKYLAHSKKRVVRAKLQRYKARAYVRKARTR